MYLPSSAINQSTHRLFPLDLATPVLFSSFLIASSYFAVFLPTIASSAQSTERLSQQRYERDIQLPASSHQSPGLPTPRSLLFRTLHCRILPRFSRAISAHVVVVAHHERSHFPLKIRAILSTHFKDGAEEYWRAGIRYYSRRPLRSKCSCKSYPRLLDALDGCGATRTPLAGDHWQA